MLDIENYRLAIPVSENDEEAFPIGFDVSYNCRNQISFDNYGTQPASPLVLILTNEGLLVSFFAINFDSKTKSICQEPKPMRFVQSAPQHQNQQHHQQKSNQILDPTQNNKPKPNQANAQISFNSGTGNPPLFNLNDSLNKPQQANAKQATVNPPGASFNFNTMPPSMTLSSQNQKVAQQPLNFNPPQMNSNLQHQHQQHHQQLQQQQQFQYDQQQKALAQKSNVNQFQQNHHQSTPSKQSLLQDCRARVNEFERELEELWTYSKVIKGKNLAKPLQLTKETLIVIEKFNELNGEIKVNLHFCLFFNVFI